MPPIKLTEVVTFTSEDPNHPAENLLRPDTFRKWKCAPGTKETQSSVTLKLEHMSSIHSVDIGNEGSAFVEVMVGREAAGDYQLLLVASSFMTPIESRNCSDMNRVRMFGPDKLNKNVAMQKWDRVKVVCTQPFNKRIQYGLSFITLRAPEAAAPSSPPKVSKLGSFTLREEEETDTIKIGSMFAQRSKNTSSPKMTGAAAIRSASAAAAASLSESPSTLKRKAQDPPGDVGFYQLKKRTPDKDPVKTSGESKPEQIPTPQPSHKRATEVKDGARENKVAKKEDGKHRSSEVKEERNRSDKGSERKAESSSKPKAAGNIQANNKPKKKQKTKPFTSLMEDVVFVMSGYQNPQRGQLRDQMLEMGAQYKPEWSSSCTHLVCAFSNTPKYQQVKGRGRIVTAKWITDSYKNKIRYPCKRYGLDKKQDQNDSEEEIWAEELLPAEPKPAAVTPAQPSTSAPVDDDYNDDVDTDDEIEKVIQRKKKNEDDQAPKNAAPTSTRMDTQNTSLPDIKTEGAEANTKQKTGPQMNDVDKPGPSKVEGKTEVSNGVTESSDEEIYENDTDVDEENVKYLTPPDTSDLPLPPLGDHFKNRHFLIYGNMSERRKKLLRRYIVAFDGVCEEYMSTSVQFVVTEDKWDKNFDEALNENPMIQFVKPSWIWRCWDKQKLTPHQPFLIVPKE